MTKQGLLCPLNLVPLDWKYELLAKMPNQTVQNVEVALPTIVIFSQLDETLAVAGVSLDHFWRKCVVFSRTLDDHIEPLRSELFRMVPDRLLRDSFVTLALDLMTQTLEIGEKRLQFCLH